MARAKKKITKKQVKTVKKPKLSVPTIVVIAAIAFINLAIALSYFFMMFTASGSLTVKYALFAINQTGYAWFFYAGIALSIVNVGLMYLVYKRRKWAFFAYLASVAVAFSMDLFIGVDIGSIVGLCAPAVLYFFLRKDMDLHLRV